MAELKSGSCDDQMFHDMLIQQDSHFPGYHMNKQSWIIPANPKFYDIEHAFDETDEIDWKQGSGIKAGDTVFMYVAAPVSAIISVKIRTNLDVKRRRGEYVGAYAPCGYGNN